MAHTYIHGIHKAHPLIHAQVTHRCTGKYTSHTHMYWEIHNALKYLLGIAFNVSKNNLPLLGN